MADAAERQIELAEREPGIEKITQKERIHQAHRFLKEYLKTNQLTKVAVARVLFRDEGDNKRTPLSRFLDDPLDERVNPTEIVIAAETLKASVEGPLGIPKFVGFRDNLRCVRMLWDFANDARDNRKMASAIAFSGFGKSEGIREYASRARMSGDQKPPVRIINCNPLIYAEELVRKLAQEMGVAVRGAASTQLDLIANRLIAHSEFLCFDEVNRLVVSASGVRSLEVIRYLHDISRCGVLLLGTPRFLRFVATQTNGTNPLTHDATENPSGRPDPADGPLASFVNRDFNLFLPGITDAEILDIAEGSLKAKIADDAIGKLCFWVNRSLKVLTTILTELRELRVKHPERKTIDLKAVNTAWEHVQSRKIAVQ